MTTTADGLSALALSPEEIAAFESLSPQEQSELIELLEQSLESAWTLFPKQELAESIFQKVDWMLFGGAAAAAKSEYACWHANNLSMKVPGHNTLLLRNSIPELRRSLILRLLARSKQFDLPMRLRKVDGSTGFHYENGSMIECGYLNADEHVGRYLGSEYDLILMDEATLLKPEWIISVAARLRTTRAKARLGARPHLGLFTNPGGIAHQWAYDLFVTPTDYGQKIVVLNVANGIENAFPVREYCAPITVNGATSDQVLDTLLPWAESLEIEADPTTELSVAFVPARAQDNPYIDPSYLKYLNALPERRRRQLRDGDWDVFTGQFFELWNRDVHVVDPFDIPAEWPRGRGIDWGSAAPWSCIYGAWSPEGDCYIYRELYGAGLTPHEQAKQAKEAERVQQESGATFTERYQFTVADPAVFSQSRGMGKSIAQMWGDSGLHVQKAKNARVAGWANVNQYLWDTDLNKPRLFVFSTCRNLIRTIPKMFADSTKPEDLDTKTEDHAVDGLRYLLYARPMIASRRQRPDGTIDSRFLALMQGRAKRKRWDT